MSTTPKTETITLADPVEFSGPDGPAILTEVTLRRPKVNDIAAMNEAIERAGGRLTVDPVSGEVDAASISNVAQMRGTIALVASMNRVDPEVIGDLSFDDFAKVMKVLPRFMPAEAKETGAA